MELVGCVSKVSVNDHEKFIFSVYEQDITTDRKQIMWNVILYAY